MHGHDAMNGDATDDAGEAAGGGDTPEPADYVVVAAYGERAARACREVAAREQDWDLLVAFVDAELAATVPPRGDPYRISPFVQVVDVRDVAMLSVAARHRRAVAPERVVTLSIGAPRSPRFADGRYGGPVARLPHAVHDADIVLGLRALLAVPALARQSVIAVSDEDVDEVLDAGYQLDVAYGAGATVVGAMSEALARIAAPGPTVGIVRAAYAAIEVPDGQERAAEDAVRRMRAALPPDARVVISVSVGRPPSVSLWLVS